MIANGTILNETYQIIQPIGSGGVGVVYKAYHLRLQKYVVIKMIKENFVGNVNVRGEVDLLKKLHHPCLPQVYDFIQLGTQVYTVMDYISGKNLEEYKKEGLLIWQEDVEKWLTQLCDVLVYLHGQKPAIIHSDIKPQNIIIDDEGNANLIDFNISFEEDTMSLQGVSQSYASYEQLETAWLIQNGYVCPEGMIDVTTDIYSLGATFYYILTGIVPYAGINEEYPITTFDIPYKAALIQIINKSMQRDIKKRYRSASKMLSDIKNLKKKTVGYRLKQSAIVFGVICAASGITFAAVNGMNTVRTAKSRQFEQAYAEVSSLKCYTQEEELQINNFLNDSRYASMLNKDSVKKAALVYRIGNYYFIRGEYAYAAEYFKEASELNSENTDYTADYAVALARANELDKAQQVLEEVKKSGIDSADIKEIEAEIMFLKGDYKNVMSAMKTLLQSELSARLQARSMLLLAKAGWKQGSYIECLEALNDISVTAQNQDLFYLIKMNTYLNYGQAQSDRSNLRTECYKSVQECYGHIENKEICSLNDRLNVVVAYQDTGRYDLAMEILNTLMTEYGEHYRVYMQAAYCCYYQAKAENGDYGKVKEYYNRAVPLYRAEAVNGNTDEEMTKLEKLVMTLK